MDERTTNEVVQDVMDDIAAKREATQETAKEEKTLADQFADSKAEQAQPEGTEDGQKKMDEITLKFGKGCVGDEFQGKDGVKYKEILVPNQDKDDHRPWQTFVVKANHVHENQYGKGMWCKLPANGTTTLHRSVKVGQDEQGKPIWDTEKTKVSNKDIDKKRIVLIGESQGGLVSALAAAERKRQISSLILIYPALCIPDNINDRKNKIKNYTR